MGGVRTALGVVAAVLALTLLAWGSTSTEPLLSAPRGLPAVAPGPTGERVDPVEVTSEPAPLEEGPPGEAAPFPWEVLVLAVLLAGVVVLLARLLRRDWSTEPEELESEVDLDALLEATSTQRRERALAEGDPRNAVVACWVALEDAAERSGLERDPAETAAEFTRRVLGQWDVDGRAVAELGDLYREARFSRHAISEDMRSRAVAAVGVVHGDLARSAGGRP